MTKRRAYMLFLFLGLRLCSAGELFCQNNLVINGGFEEYDESNPQFCYATGNFSEPLIPGWHNYDLSPDLYNSACNIYCTPFPVGCMLTVPYHTGTIANTDIQLERKINYLPAHNGEGYSSIIIASTFFESENFYVPARNVRESIQGSFSQPLKKGQGYCIEFWVACSDIVNHATDQLGIYFHKSDQPYRKDIFGFDDFNFLELTPQVVIHTGPMMDTSGWTKIETEYIAEGSERFFILGNFQQDDEINWIKWQHNYDDEKWGVFTLIYFDDIAVYECDHIAIPEEEISPPDIITPNGDGINDAFDIYGLPPGSSLVIYNRWGAEVYKSDNYQNDWQGRTKSGAPVPDGTYFYVLTMPHGTRKAGTLTVVR